VKPKATCHISRYSDKQVSMHAPQFGIQSKQSSKQPY